jgi:heme o synthase
VVILFGAQVANFDAGLLCLGFPLCNGSALPPEGDLARLHWSHRVLALGFVIVLGLLVSRLYRSRAMETAAVRRWAMVVLGATLIQIAVAAAMILHLLPTGLRALHLLVGTVIWAALVSLTFYSARTRKPLSSRAHARDLARDARTIPGQDPSVAEPALSSSEGLPRDDSGPSLTADLVSLTKPKIISLLLVTTVAPMFITPAGLPSPALVFWVVVGGYLMAGGANAINMWFDRDIDTQMARTKLRPIPAGRISPAAGLAFGVGLAALAFAVFWLQINPLSAWLALGGLLFYVFVYTVWLKRSSPQNIVIGGAAGAFPPLVGWAAMTGGLDLAAVYLFAIIFYWTPPHFWALALVKQADYARASIPMMPVVRGEARTKYEMLVYTLILLPLTILPFFFGALGPFYLVAATLLGARLLWHCMRVVRQRPITPVAWGMYRYSLLYLALLFVAMSVDRHLPFGQQVAPQVIILDHASRQTAIPVRGHVGH